MKILFIRHGESTNNVLEEMPGMNREKYKEMRNKDPALSEKGKMQVHELILRIPRKAKFQSAKKFLIHKNDFHFKYEKKIVYCSALERGLDSANILKKRLKCKVQVMTDLCEEGGMYHKDDVFKGISKSKLLEKFPDFVLNESEINEEGWYFRDHRENNIELKQRANKIAEFVQSLALDGKDVNDAIVFVSHGRFLNEKLHVLLELDPFSDFYFKHVNGGITCFETNTNGELYLNFFNYKDHLDYVSPKL